MSEIEFVSQQKFAELRGVSKGTVSKWKQRGFLVIEPETGNVDVAASSERLAGRPETYRGGTIARSKAGTRTARPVSRIRKDETPEHAAERIVFGDGRADLTHAEAARKKENYLALLQQLKYDMESSKVVAVDEVCKQVAVEYAAVRSRLLSIPAKIAPVAAFVGTPEEVQELLGAEISDALSELTFDVQLSERSAGAGA